MKRVIIDRLELDLRGVAPANAQEAARLLGPALQRALAKRSISASPAERLDAGRIDITASAQPPSIATRAAERIAQHISRGARK
jgi:hypothetical protein